MKKGCGLFLVIIIIIAVSGFLFAQNWYNNAIFNREETDDTIEYTVESGATFSSVLDDLIENGYKTEKLAVQLYLRSKGLSPNIKVGEFLIPLNANIPELIDILEQGVLKPATTVTIKEGLRYEQIADILESSISNTTQFDKEEFLRIADNPDLYEFSTEVETFLNTHKPSGKSLRGLLYPDTYRIDEGSTTVEVVNFMLENFISQVNTKLDLDNLTSNQQNFTDLYSGLILASIIEKEASAWDDRSEISGVFHNRLRTNMPLGSDATVNFFTGKNDAGVTFADRDRQSPYNTYLNVGLPPTPINNPRIESLDAALKPNITNYFFFYHTPDGKTFYNQTLGGHSAGVCRDLGC